MATEIGYRILCVGDSRLSHLQLALNDNCRNIKFVCFVFPGATLGRLAYELRKIMFFTSEGYYKYILVVGGICDLTRYRKLPSRQISLAYTTLESITDNFQRLYSLFRDTVSLFTNIPIVMSTICGIHLSRYVDEEACILQSQQNVLDTAIPLINVVIKEIGSIHKLPVIDLAKFIHHSKGKGGVYRTRYSRLHDGCHPGEETRLLWINEILKTLTNSIYSI